MPTRDSNDNPQPSRRTRSRTAATTPEPPAAEKPHGAVVNALIFILKEIAQNNPDVKTKAEQHMHRLDRLRHHKPEPAAAPTPPAAPPPVDVDEDEEEEPLPAAAAAAAPETVMREANGGSRTDPQAVAKALGTRPSSRFTRT